ncbi:KIAA0319L family protein [Megaselia abdita]
MENFLLFSVIVLVFSSVCSVAQETPSDDESSLSKCDTIFKQVFEQSAPRENRNAGTIKLYGDSTNSMDLISCVAGCCEAKNETCNVAFLYKQNCYHVSCKTNEACLPEKKTQTKAQLRMVLVRPVRDSARSDISWMDLLKENKLEQFYSASPEQETAPAVIPRGQGLWSRINDMDSLQYLDDDITAIKRKPVNINYDSDFDDDSTPFTLCELDRDCGKHEECALLNLRNGKGLCKCINGYEKNQDGHCIGDLVYASSIRDEILKPLKSKLLQESLLQAEGVTIHPLTEKLAVSVVNKTVHLPEKETTLSAYVVPDEQIRGDTYKYLWSVIDQPNGVMNGTISEQTKSKVSLTNLSEGVYVFRVKVSGNGSYGEAVANITVIPEKRINKIPEVIITPKEQTIKLPTSVAILDGSTSQDDDKIVNWKWELIRGPIGYQPKLPETSTLQLTDLTSPGNYTFKLTVTDSDTATNSTSANIVVLKGTDYPPEANAGADVILYLPHNNVTLNGTLSKDDQEIVAWEWTKDDSDQTKAVDMQNTRTPYLQLSNLEEGMYTFVLKVTDGSGQSGTSSVHVFVKPQTNQPPVAKAGSNSTINLPQSFVKLDGSGSSDDIGIKSWRWTQISGPNSAIFENANVSVTNATGLTIGDYVFELTVQDENKNSASDRVYVKIVQEKNLAPTANAGGDQTITLPVKAIYLNGTKSTDDLKIVNYTWTREGTSLATGVIVGDSDKKNILVLTDVVPGRYVFKLTVWDEQGLSSSDTVSVIVRQDPHLMDLVEITLPNGVSSLTQAELDSLKQKIVLLLGDVELRIRELKTDHRTEAAILIFYVEKLSVDGKFITIPGKQVQQILKDKLWKDASILGTTFPDVRTTVCQNQCSGHGICNAVTRGCICDTFWMPSVFYFWSLEEANCDWSILYVIIACFIGFLLLSGMFCAITCFCRKSKKPRSRPKVQKYSPLGSHDEETPPRGLNILEMYFSNQNVSFQFLDKQSFPTPIQILMWFSKINRNSMVS